MTLLLLLQDALQAQMVIKKMSEMIDSKPQILESENVTSNEPFQDLENNVEVSLPDFTSCFWKMISYDQKYN